ncbi:MULTISPECIES: bile acid:sodium symporter family protein [unclassified Sphingomonas]|uniref:bile acid:sodium symporter family protein n=1 Tax=unclassified Sphingomonas TaxID=196159 RepID=UPI00044F15B5|nr:MULTISPECIES: bile acid:sodium symporter family protein [unclassified Sphingomonas]EZP56731.1 Sodium Bile acid symporter family protein [Sphingomonas sp. RIT328]
MFRSILSFFEPFILMLLGTVLLASLIPARGIWAGIAGDAADVGIVLLFFLHGAKLSREAIWEGARNWRLHVAVLATTFVVFPLLGLVAGRTPGLAGPVATGMLFLTLLPSTVQSSIAFTAIARGNVAAAVCSASFSNLIGIVATPALVALLIGSGEGGGGISLAAVESIVAQLLVPFVAGHLLRPWIGGWIARRKRLLTIVDRGSILLVVYTAFGAAVVEGLWHRVSPADLLLIGVLCAVLLAVVLTVTWFAGRALGFSREDAIVLLFCGSKKSLASGVPMAGVLFPAATVGAVLLPVMLFHQLQLIACAVIARRYADAASLAEAEAVSL